MNAYRRQAVGLGILGVLGTASLLWAQATTQPADADSRESAAAVTQAGGRQVGYVDGNNVYVRSGFHQNYYPVTQLNRGDEVVVLGEEFGWLKIKPPVGTYSLVERGYIDKRDDRGGVTNDSVWVHAGSNLNDRRYARQVQLPAGAEVALIGETSDGAYYKIEPPEGAALWIKGDFVRRDRPESPVTEPVARASSAAPPLEPIPPGELDLSGELDLTQELTRVSTTQPAETARRTGEERPRPERPSSEQVAEHQLEMNAIEAMIAAESTKPFESRVYEPVIARLEALAAQAGGDEITQIYAQTRIEQLKGQMEVIAAVGELDTLKERTIDEADRLAAIRARIRAEEGRPMDDIIVRGEIRVSGLYDGVAGRPRRWRIVGREGSPQAGRTLAYLELEPGSTINPVEYYGKYVGVRSSGRRMLEGTIPPVPIFTIREIAVLDPASSDEPITRRERVDAPPATQPAEHAEPTAPATNEQGGADETGESQAGE